MQYYKAYDLGNNIYHIYEPGETYTSLIVGTEKALLIDTGYGFGDLHGFIRTLTDLPLIVVNTHGHYDHAGGNFQFENVYMHRDECRILEQYIRDVRPVAVRNFQKKAKEENVSVLPRDFDVQAYMSHKYDNVSAIEHGHVFDLGNRQIRVWKLPGHTASHLVFVDSMTGIVFGGDTISNNVWVQFDFSVPLHEYVDAIKAFKDNVSFTGFLTSHSKRLFPKRLIDCILQAIEHIDDTKSKVFIHPRTGEMSRLHTERLNDEEGDGLKKIHIIYNKDNM